MLAIIYNTTLLACARNSGNNTNNRNNGNNGNNTNNRKLKIVEEPKLILFKENKSLDTLKRVRALKFSLNEEVDKKDIILTMYTIKTDPKEKYSFEKHCPKKVPLENVLVMNKNAEQQDVLVKLGNVNINNNKEFIENYLKKINEECLMSEVVYYCRLGKIDLINEIKVSPIWESLIHLKKEFEQALQDEVWEDILNTKDQSIILQFVSLKTRVCQSFLMYCYINIIEYMFNRVFMYVQIVNDKGKILEREDVVLYIFKEAIRRSRQKFNMENIEKTKNLNPYRLDNEKNINCIVSELKKTLEKQYPSERGVAIKYKCYENFEGFDFHKQYSSERGNAIGHTSYEDSNGCDFSDIIIKNIISKFLPNYFEKIAFFLDCIDIHFQETIKNIQDQITNVIEQIKTDLGSFNNILSYKEYSSRQLKHKKDNYNFNVECKNIYEECNTIQAEINKRLELLQNEWEQIEIFESLFRDNVAFNISFSSGNLKKREPSTKYYKFVSLTEIEEISKNKLHFCNGWFRLIYIGLFIIFVVVPIIVTYWCIGGYRREYTEKEE